MIDCPPTAGATLKDFFGEKNFEKMKAKQKDQHKHGRSSAASEKGVSLDDSTIQFTDFPNGRKLVSIDAGSPPSCSCTSLLLCLHCPTPLCAGTSLWAPT